MNIFNIINMANSEYGDYGYRTQKLEELETLICHKFSFNDIYTYYQFVKFADKNKIERVLLESKNPKFVYLIALKNRYKINVKYYEDKLINYGGVKWYADYAQKIKGANVTRLEDETIKYNDPELILKFALSVKNANIQKLEQAIIKTNSAKYIYLFATNVKGANKKKLKKVYNRAKYFKSLNESFLLK